jgi:hypothetical protein
MFLPVRRSGLRLAFLHQHAFFLLARYARAHNAGSGRAAFRSGTAQAGKVVLVSQRSAVTLSFLCRATAAPAPNYSVKWTAAMVHDNLTPTVAAATYLRR